MTSAFRQKPYTSLYCEKIFEALECLEKMDFRIFMALAAHADRLGVCFPGDARLGRLTKHAETTIEAGLKRLQQFGYIRILIYRNPIRRKVETSYQLSPHIFAIHPEDMVAALGLWNQQYYENDLNIGTGLTKDSQPPPELQSITNTSEPTPVSTTITTTKTTLFPKGEKQGWEWLGNNTDSAENAKHNTVGPAPQGATKNGKAVNQRQSFPPVPPLPPLPTDAGKLPLPDERDESAAFQVHSQFKGVLTIINARRAIIRFGRDKVLAAANNSLLNPTAVNPVGIMFSNLRQGLVTPGVDGLPPVDWTMIEIEIRHANFKWNWVNYRHLLNRHDCPDWFKHEMAFMAENYSEDGFATEAASD